MYKKHRQHEMGFFMTSLMKSRMTRYHIRGRSKTKEKNQNI